MAVIRFSPFAARKLDGAYEYIAQTLKSPAAASSTIAGILSRLDILKANPDIGPRLSSRIELVPARFCDTRYLVCNNHIAIYDHVGDTVQVLAIYHGREDYFGRLFTEID
jgi:plasmid stabilization system protein ParE